MTVQKRRDPRNFKGAVTRILGVLGDEACATAVGKSASLIYKWSDPDRDSLPSVEQALALDLAYIAAGEGSAPIGAVYSAALECDYQVDDGPPKHLHASALAATAAWGAFCQRLAETHQSATAEKISLSRNEAIELHELCDRFLEDLQDVAVAIDAAAAISELRAVPLRASR